MAGCRGEGRAGAWVHKGVCMGAGGWAGAWVSEGCAWGLRDFKLLHLLALPARFDPSDALRLFRLNPTRAYSIYVGSMLISHSGAQLSAGHFSLLPPSKSDELSDVSNRRYNRLGHSTLTGAGDCRAHCQKL